MATALKTGLVFDHLNIEHNTGLALVSAPVPAANSPGGPESYDLAPLAVYGAFSAVDGVSDGIMRNAYALVRHPRHCAIPDKAMGFCFFNKVAISARYAQNRHDMAKVAILDWDLHHGSGKQAVFSSGHSVIFNLLHFVASGRLVAFHEGGYNQGYAPVCTWAAVEGMSGIHTGHEDPYELWLGAIPSATEVGASAASIDRVHERHRAQWRLA